MSTVSLYPDSKVHGANMGSTSVLSAPNGHHVGPMNLSIRDIMFLFLSMTLLIFFCFICYTLFFFLDMLNQEFVSIVLSTQPNKGCILTYWLLTSVQ